MIIKVKYDKIEKTLEVSNDIPECSVVVNNSATIDTDDDLVLELSLDTTYLAETQQDLDGELN
jgi:hypothetical protein